MTAPEPTNDAVSDERLREIAEGLIKRLAWTQDGRGHWKAGALSGTYHIVQKPGDLFQVRMSWSLMLYDHQCYSLADAKEWADKDWAVRATSYLNLSVLDALNRRSVTSQASEGAVARGAEDNPANVADAILRQVRRTLAAEKKHASFPPGSTETSRDDADFEYSILAGFSLAQVDAALAVVRRRKDASPSKRVERPETALEWKKLEREARADVMGLQYRVRDFSPAWKHPIQLTIEGFDQTQTKVLFFDNMDEGKGAAQADFNQRLQALQGGRS